MSGVDRVKERLDRIKGTDSDFVASCPVASHGQGRGDHNPSLHVTYSSVEGKTLIHCQAGCHPQDVMAALGLEWSDLFDGEVTSERGHKVAEWKYHHTDGSVWMIVERWQMPGGKRFVHRVPGKATPGWPPNFRPCLYNLPEVVPHASAGGEVYLVEGEKCVSAARQLGLIATCAPNGTSGWKNYYCRWLKGCSLVTIVADNDEPGRKFAATASASLTAHGIKTRVMGVAIQRPKADLYDHVIAGFGIEDLVPLTVNRLRPPGAMLADLIRTEFPPVKWAVPGLISTGLSLLGGAPKMGKSYLALDLALGVACGGIAMQTLPCNQGSVLYLALDNEAEWRIKARSLYLWGGAAPDVPVPIEVHTEWPTGDAAIAACQEWVNEAESPLLVVVDTLVRVEPAFDGDGSRNAYVAATDVLGRWARMAKETGVAVLAVHHDNKGQHEDWMNRFTGSRGVTATAQTLLMIDAGRNESEGMLRVSGRDLETGDLEIRRIGRTWALVDRVPAAVG